MKELGVKGTVGITVMKARAAAWKQAKFTLQNNRDVTFILHVHTCPHTNIPPHPPPPRAARRLRGRLLHSLVATFESPPFLRISAPAAEHKV